MWQKSKLVKPYQKAFGRWFWLHWSHFQLLSCKMQYPLLLSIKGNDQHRQQQHMSLFAYILILLFSIQDFLSDVP